MKKEIDTSYQMNKIVCPYCGHEDRDIWDHDLNTDDINELQCDHCEKNFFVSIFNPIYFTTGKTTEEARGY